MTTTRTQLRGICPVCLSQHATKNGLMVSHGFTVGFGFQNNSCDGTEAPHLGSKDAPSFILSYGEKLFENLLKRQEYLTKLQAELETLTDLGSRNKKSRFIQQTMKDVKMQDRLLTELKERHNNWKESDLVEVDLDVEDAEMKKAADLKRDEKRIQREAKAKEKEEKRIQREEKAKAKWDAILAENTHIVEIEGEVIAEWVQSYKTKRELELDHYDKVRKHFNDNNVENHVQLGIIHGGLIAHRVRVIGKKGKQLHKF